MSQLSDFLRALFGEGRAALQARAEPLDPRDKDALAVLQRAYDAYQLEIAGPLIAFEPKIALAAAVLVHNACWFLVSRDETEAQLKEVLVFPDSPRSPSAHLSADLLLRFLPQVHRRAKAHNPVDALAVLLADVLRRWPLSGVFADLPEGPLAPLDFGGHPGLQILYAERLAEHEKPNWAPPPGRVLECAEMVYEELGKDFAPLRHASQTHNNETADGKRVRSDE
jgi:hypothetical protein